MTRRGSTASGPARYLGLLATVGWIGAVAGCGDDSICFHGGRQYSVGDRFGDCNLCTCEATGQVSCLLMLCLNDASSEAPDGPGDVRQGSDAGTGMDARHDPDAGIGGDTPWAADVPSNADVRADQDGQTDGGRARDGIELDGNGTCTLPARLLFGYEGGMVMYQDEHVLDPPGTLTITRTHHGRSGIDGPAVRTCTPPLPPCGTSAAVSLANIVEALQAPDVKAAFQRGKTVLYGVDMRPVDGPLWSITLVSEDATLQVGSPCSASNAGCRPTPPAVQRLADDLKALADAATATTECAGL